MDTAKKWDPQLYTSLHSYISKLGEPLVEMLDPQPDERIADLGCGTGELSNKIAERGAMVIGFDSSEEMIRAASHRFPKVDFFVLDIKDLSQPNVFDGVFSNASLHWVKPPEIAIGKIFRILKPGGRFVAEFGGKGNCALLIDTVSRVLNEFDMASEWINPWYFPSLGEYATLLERQGFIVQDGHHFERPTTWPTPDGLHNWLQMFVYPYMSVRAQAEKTMLFNRIESLLAPKRFHGDHWIADYIRLRIKAIKPA